MNANDASNANDGIEQAAIVENEVTSLSSSQFIIDAEDADILEFVVVYDSVDQKIAKKVTKVITEKNLTEIKKEAFKGCPHLKEVDMSASLALETIGDWAFAECSALCIVKWAPNLKIIGDDAFVECTKLQNVDWSEAHALETIGDEAFYKCSALSVVKWAPNVKTIGDGAFLGCTKLQDVDLSEAHALETIGNWAFAFCSAVSVVKWAPNVKIIGKYTFLKCTNLQDIMIPSRCHWFVRKLPFAETKLQSVDMQGHDLKKAIRIKNLYPQATPRLSMNRLVSMYAKSPLTNAELENAACNDESVTEFWTEARVGDLQRLEEIQKAYADSIFKLLHWYAGNGLLENLVVNRRKRKRDSCNVVFPGL